MNMHEATLCVGGAAGTMAAKLDARAMHRLWIDEAWLVLACFE